jgi:lipoprotein NlpI
LRNQPDNAYLVLWLYLSQVKFGDSGALTNLDANASRLVATEWPYIVVQLFLGKRSSIDILSVAKTTNEQCEAQFYLGEWQLMRGQRPDARAAFKSALGTCPRSFYEYGGAASELKRLP